MWVVSKHFKTHPVHSHQGQDFIKTLIEGSKNGMKIQKRRVISIKESSISKLGKEMVRVYF
jgi:hypothetical protein